MRVLVVEDHVDYADVIARGLRRAGMAVDVARDGGEGWVKASVSDYDPTWLPAGTSTERSGQNR